MQVELFLEPPLESLESAGELNVHRIGAAANPRPLASIVLESRPPFEGDALDRSNV
jgi:hypothetical protein